MSILYGNRFNCNKCNRESEACSHGDGKVKCRNCGASYPGCVGKSSLFEKLIYRFE